MTYREVFGEILADHHESPRNYGELPAPAVKEQGYNPLCGDKVLVSLAEDGTHHVSACQFTGEGCSICMASASIMTEMVQGKTHAEALRLIEAFREKMQGAQTVDGLPSDESGEDITALYGIQRFPVRIKCVLLPWTTLKKSLEKVGGETHAG